MEIEGKSHDSAVLRMGNAKSTVPQRSQTGPKQPCWGGKRSADAERKLSTVVSASGVEEWDNNMRKACGGCSPYHLNLGLLRNFQKE